MIKKRWTVEEIKLLQEGKHDLLNRSKSSIVNMLKRLNLRPRFEFRKPWPNEHIELLKKMKEEGASPKEIYGKKILPYSENAIKKQLGRLGLCKKKYQNRFSDKNLKQLKAFLLLNYENNTPDDLTKMWNKQSAIKTNKDRIVYHLVQMKIKLPKKQVTKLKNSKKYALLLKFLEKNWQNNTPEELTEMWNNENEQKVTKNLVCIKLRSLGLKVSQKEVMAIKYIKNKEKDMLKIKTSKSIEQIRLAKIRIMQRRIAEGKDLWTGLASNEICLEEDVA